MKGVTCLLCISYDCFGTKWVSTLILTQSVLPLLIPGHHHHVPVHPGPAAALHGLPDSAGAHAEEASVRTLAAHPERRRRRGNVFLSAWQHFILGKGADCGT